MAPRFVPDDIPRWVQRLPDPAAAAHLEEIVDQCSPHDERRRGLDQCLSDSLRAAQEAVTQGHVVALLVRLNRKGLERILDMTLKDRNTIDDVIQESVVKVLINLEKFRTDADGRSFGPWFHAIVRNCRVDDFRKNRPQDALPADLMEAGPGPDFIIQTRDQWALIKERLENLPHWKRRVLQLRIVEGRTLQDILEIIPARDFPEGKLPSVPTLSRWIHKILAELAGENTDDDSEGGPS